MRISDWSSTCALPICLGANPPLPNQPGAQVITAPVRSGRQIYAYQRDLVALASVSPGAELLADGHIHVYGALRGRALAGVTRSEEHTSELQSLMRISYAVFCLKKKKTTQYKKNQHTHIPINI